MKNILILCTGNSCRSQIAEGYLKHFAGEKAPAKATGNADEVMNEFRHVQDMSKRTAGIL